MCSWSLSFLPSPNPKGLGFIYTVMSLLKLRYPSTDTDHRMLHVIKEKWWKGLAMGVGEGAVTCRNGGTLGDLEVIKTCR